MCFNVIHSNLSLMSNLGILVIHKLDEFDLSNFTMHLLKPCKFIQGMARWLLFTKHNKILIGNPLVFNSVLYTVSLTRYISVISSQIGFNGVFLFKMEVVLHIKIMTPSMGCFLSTYTCAITMEQGNLFCLSKLGTHGND